MDEIKQIPTGDTSQTSGLLDPWLHAQEIAQRWQVPDCRVVIAVGAQSWCETCRTILPQWQTFAQAAPAWAQVTKADMLCLWLDLEDHQEFLGDFIPDDLPWLFFYQDQALIWQGAWRSLGPQVQTALQTFAQTGTLPHAAMTPDDFGLAERLLRPNWANLE